MSIGKGLLLYLIDGQPSGRIACEIFNWTGKGYKLPRTRLKESASRSELYRAGVYFLFGRDEVDPETHLVYVGEAEEVYKRLAQHQEKDFWNDAVLFISKDDNLNKAHVKFLEFKLYETIRGAGRAILQNGNTPTRPAISELERDVMEEFFQNIKLSVSTLGYRIFEPLAQRSQPETPIVEDTQELDHDIERDFYLNGPRGVKGQAVMTNEGLVMKEGSRAIRELMPSAAPRVAELRSKLVESGVLIDDGTHLVLSKDYLATSPSSASDILLGRSSNGRIEWRDGTGTPLKEVEETGTAASA